MRIIERDIMYGDDWIYDAVNQQYISCTGEVWTEEEFEEIQRLSLIDTINRVPFDSEDADRGTAFNEIVDCFIDKKFIEVQENVFIFI